MKGRPSRTTDTWIRRLPQHTSWTGWAHSLPPLLLFPGSPATWVDHVYYSTSTLSERRATVKVELEGCRAARILFIIQRKAEKERSLKPGFRCSESAENQFMGILGTAIPCCWCLGLQESTSLLAPRRYCQKRPHFGLSGTGILYPFSYSWRR